MASRISKVDVLGIPSSDAERSPAFYLDTVMQVERAIDSGSTDHPWVLRAPPGASEYRVHRDDSADPPELVSQVGSTRLAHEPRNNKMRAV